MNRDHREEAPRPAAGGAALGRKIAGTAGEVAGGVAGALIGGVARRIADALDPEENAASRPDPCCDTAAEAEAATAPPGYRDPYRTYRPAYAYGRGARERHGEEAGWDDIEAELERGWRAIEDRLEVSWERAKDAVREGWDRVEGGFAELFEEQDEHWRVHYAERPYVAEGASYETYRPAYRYGAEQRLYRYDREWDDVADDIARDWARIEARNALAWDDAKYAVRDGWQYVESRLPGDYDRDGR